MSVNRWIGIGHLGRDVVVKHLPDGVPVATLSMACSERWTDKSGQRQERTEWVRIVVFGKTGETLAPYLVKGKQIYVEGKLQTREWTDREGQKKYTTEIRSDRIVLLGSGGERASVASERGDEETPGRPVTVAARADYDDTDIPW
jgi:single-strand DNA-binding protein